MEKMTEAAAAVDDPSSHVFVNADFADLNYF